MKIEFKLSDNEEHCYILNDGEVVGDMMKMESCNKDGCVEVGFSVIMYAPTHIEAQDSSEGCMREIEGTVADDVSFYLDTSRFYPKTCDVCNGSGTVSKSILHPKDPNLDSWDVRTCWSCMGKGKK